MKRTVSLFLTFVFVFSFSFPCFCVVSEIDSDIQYFDDGSYCVIEIVDRTQNPEDTPQSIFAKLLKLLHNIIALFTNTKTVTKTKHISYYDSKDVLLWTFYLTAEFSYNGKTASCKKVSASSEIKDSDWRVVSSNCNKEGKYAIGNTSMRQYKLGVSLKLVDYEVKMACSPMGNVT